MTNHFSTDDDDEDAHSKEKEIVKNNGSDVKDF